ncbi:MAG TPA: DUF3631 domain-containing protein [Candidatus Angelobacter sp.]
MHPFDDNYLSKMSPEFEKKPRTEAPAPPPPPAAQPAKASVDLGTPKLFDSIAAYISQHLACDPHQLTVLALWVAHTWSFQHCLAAVYLNVCSPEPQSGKTLCLNLLRQLARNPSFVAGSSPGSLMKYLLTDNHRLTEEGDSGFDTTLFVDNCHHIFGPTERQPILALLNSGSDAGLSYLSAPHEYSFFAPKAFAGNAPLPSSLAQRCIPITLRRKKFSDARTRFRPHKDHRDAVDLVHQLVAWLDRNGAAIEKTAQTSPPRIPPGHTPREQACAEPLLHLADLIGGSWPEKARAAVSNLFRLAQGTEATELLCDIRALFFSKQDPEYLSTKDLLAGLATLAYRPWAKWTRGSGQKIAALLRPLGISARPLHYGTEPMFRGYLFKDFADAWERYIPPLLPTCATKKDFERNSATTTPL